MRDHQGGYHLPQTDEVQFGVLEKIGRDLYFAGKQLETARRNVLRPGDEVEARVVGEEVRIVRVVARSERPLSASCGPIPATRLSNL